MSKKKKRTDVPDCYEAIRKIRGDWGAINPVTKIITNKKKNPRTKHKGREFEE